MSGCCDGGEGGSRKEVKLDMSDIQPTPSADYPLSGCGVCSLPVMTKEGRFMT